MPNRHSPRLHRWMRSLRRFIAVYPAPRANADSRVARGSLDSPRQREVQLELDLFDRRKHPWFFTD